MGGMFASTPLIIRKRLDVRQAVWGGGVRHSCGSAAGFVGVRAVDFDAYGRQPEGKKVGKRARG